MASDDDDPVAIDSSDEFDRYVASFRQRTCGPENRDLPMQTSETPESDSVDSDQISLSRRGFTVATAAAAASAATAGTAAAADGPSIDWTLDESPTPALRPDATEVEEASPDDPLAYVADDGSDASLADYGGRVRPRSSDSDPHNPFSFAPDNVASPEFSEFPRGATDADDDPISALDPSRWTGVDAALSLSETTPASGGDGLRIESSGLSSGSTATAEFSEFSIDSGPERKYLQLVLDVRSLSGSAEIRLKDDSGVVATGTIDSAADPSTTSTIAASTGATVYQTQVGELASPTTIQSVVVAILDGDATIDILALNLEKETSWTFGSREVTNADGEVETEDITEPTGETSFSDLSTMDIADPTITPLSVETEYLPTESSTTEVDPADPAYDTGVESVANLEVPTAYALTHTGSIDMVLTPGVSGDQYVDLAAGTSTDPVEDMSGLDDVSTSDYTGTVSTAAADAEVNMLTGIGTSEVAVVDLRLDLMSDQLSAMDSGGVAGFTGGGSGGFLQSPMGFVSAIVAGVGGYVAIARGWIGSLLS